jgi:uncharacterized protein
MMVAPVAARNAMSTPADPLSLADWRRTVAQLYATARAARVHDAARAAQEFRRDRDRLFAEHHDSPIARARRSAWHGTDWFAYDPAWCVNGTVDLERNGATFDIVLASDGILHCARVGTVSFTVDGTRARLALYWLCGYGGGLWLPFADRTNGNGTYAGGRYLYDTIKGADLGARTGELLLDFNYAYNPSCAYDDAWSCPLSPVENRLPFEVRAGERMPS